MAMINLRPWREEQREIRQKKFYIHLVLAVSACLFLVALSYLQTTALISQQQQRNLLLSQEIEKVASEMEQVSRSSLSPSRVINRLQSIQQLQVNRSLITRLFEVVVTTIPSDCKLLSMSKREEYFFLEGLAASNDDISRFVRNLDESAVLEKTELLTLGSDSAQYPGFTWFSLKALIQESSGNNR